MTRRLLATTALAALLATASVGAFAQFGWFGSRNDPPAAASDPKAAPEEDKGVLASLISRVLSTPGTQVSIGAVDGALSSNAVIRDIQISDREGVWLKLDQAKIVWSRLALLQRRLQIDELTIGNLEIARKPLPSGEEPAASDKDAKDEPILPELPLKVEVKAFDLKKLALGQPLLGVAADLSASGNAKLGNDPQEGLSLTFDAKRLDKPGTIAVRLGFVPQGQKLDVTAKIDEPEDSLIAHLASIPGQPPVSLDLDGHGTLDAFASKLAFKAGEDIGANGTANLARQGSARVAKLDMEARIEGLLPEMAAPIFAGTTRLTGDTQIGDDGSLTIPGINLVAAAARLDIAGTLKDNNADLTVSARNVPNRGQKTALSGLEIGKLDFKTRILGPILAPNVDVTLEGRDTSLPAGRLDSLDFTFKAVPTGKDAAGKTKLDLTADGRAAGITPKDAALARAIGDRVTLALRGQADTGGTLAVERMNIGTPTAAARFSGTLGAENVRGKLNLSAEDLRAFAQIAKAKLAGSANLDIDIEGAPREKRMGATLDGHVAKFATGIAPVDGLFGGKVALGGKVTSEGSGFRFDKLTLGGQNLTTEVNGEMRQDSADLDVTGTLPDLKRVDGRLTGRGALKAKVTGGLKAPNAVGEIALLDGSLMGRPVPRLALSLDAKDLTGATDATVKLDGTIDKKPARGGLHLARPAGGGVVADNIDLSVGSAKVKGGVMLDTRNLARGQLNVDIPNLDDLSALALQKLAGTVRADVSLDDQGGGQGAQIKAQAFQVNAAGVTILKADADLTLSDIYRRPAISGRASVDEAKVAGERIGKIRLDATGSGGASDVTLGASARGFALDTKARIVPGEQTRIEIGSLNAVRGRDRVTLAGPATVTLVEGGADLRNVVVGLGSGRVSLNGLVGSRLDLTAEAKGVPLSVAEMASPGLGLGGTFEGQARITGTPAAPSGEYRARIDGLSAPQIRSLNLGKIDITANGRLDAGRATIDSNINAGRAGTFRISGSAPATGPGQLDLAIKGNLDANAATTGLLAADGRRLTGRIDIDAHLRGTPDKPEASGSATLSGGSFTDAGQGVSLANLQARVVARGEEIVIEQGSASTRNGGSISASGRVRLDPNAGFPGEIKIVGQNAELVRSQIATAVANLNLALSGPLARDPRIAGRVDITSATIRIPERLPASLKPLPNARHIHPTKTAQKRLALDKKDKKGAAAPAFDAKLDLTVAIPGSVRVLGRGLNAQVGGSLKLAGTASKPVANGGFDLQYGTLQVATAKLDFRRGKVSFNGSLTPEIDFEANTNSGGAAITVLVSGPADNLDFKFTSSPDLPQDEVLSRLLFNSPAGQLSPFQALALAQAAAQFSGNDGAFEGLRRSLGLSGVDIGLGQGGLAGGLQRGLGDRINVGVKAGQTAAQTGVGVDVRVTNEIKLQGEVTSNGGRSMGIGAQYEW